MPRPFQRTAPRKEPRVRTRHRAEGLPSLHRDRRNGTRNPRPHRGRTDVDADAGATRDLGGGQKCRPDIDRHARGLSRAIQLCGANVRSDPAGVFATVGLVLVAIGVFSVMAYSVSLETHEIGVRMALGRPTSNVLKMVLGKGLRLITSGIVLGVLASMALTRFIASQFWGVSPRDPITFIGSDGGTGGGRNSRLSGSRSTGDQGRSAHCAAL